MQVERGIDGSEWHSRHRQAQRHIADHRPGRNRREIKLNQSAVLCAACGVALRADDHVHSHAARSSDCFRDERVLHRIERD